MKEINKLLELCNKMNSYVIPYDCHVEFAITMNCPMFNIVDYYCNIHCVISESNVPFYRENCKVPRDVIEKMIDECLEQEE